MKRIAVIGAGLIGARHVAQVRAAPGAELACVVDPVAERRPADAPGFAAIGDVDVPVDGAIVATPTPLHAAHVETCLARSWPVLLEKPIAGDVAEARRIAAASARRGIPVLVGHHRRYHDSFAVLARLLESGEIGRPVTASLIWAVRKPDAYFKGTWRAGSAGSPVLINLVHDLDFLRGLFGDITEIAALGAQPERAAGRVETGAVALRFAGGVLGTIAFADCAPSPWGFEAGTAENPNIAATGADCLWIATTAGGVSFPSLTVWSGAADWSEAARPRRLEARPTDPLAAQLDHFLEVIDGAPPRVSAQGATETLAAALEIERQVSQERRCDVA